MASSSKKKTTFAKLNREQKVRERQQRKIQRKEQRKQEAAEAALVGPGDALSALPEEEVEEDS